MIADPWPSDETSHGCGLLVPGGGPGLPVVLAYNSPPLWWTLLCFRLPLSRFPWCALGPGGTGHPAFVCAPRPDQPWPFSVTPPRRPFGVV